MEEKRVELLAPAGSFDALTAVICAGADAVYIGGSKFGARAYAENFSEEEVIKAIDYVHLHGKKLYLTVNTLLKNKEMQELYSYLKPYYTEGLDGIIIQDIGVLHYVKNQFPGLPIHASTQMTITGVEGVRFLESIGVDRIVMAREMSLEEIKKIHIETNVEIESFIHGALCYCYSGQCLFSSMVGGRSGNRGRCAQPCRLPFDAKNEKGIYPLSLKDLCTIEMIPEMIQAGIYSFKIEGRMKQPEYAAGVTSIYRKYIDSYLNNPNKSFQVEQKDYQELLDIGNRGGFTKGYYIQKNGPKMITINNPSYQSEGKELLKKIREKYIQKELKVKIKGFLRLSENNPMIFDLKCNRVEVCIKGEKVESAKKQPMLEENIRKQILKTGNTPFEFEELEIKMDNSIFIPIQKLNELRRNALSKIQNELLKNHKRNLSEEHICKKALNKDLISLKKNSTNTINVYIEKKEYLSIILKKKEIAGIYLDINILGPDISLNDLNDYVKACHDHDKKCYLALPYIFREYHRKKFYEIKEKLLNCELDGFLVRNIDEIGFIKNAKCHKTIILDYNMYTYNQSALEFWMEQSIIKNTIPLELNEKELKWRSNENSECIIYGYLPLMISAQCVSNTLYGCKKSQKEEQQLTIVDRFQNKFFIKNQCTFCYNIIYNCKPLVLWNEKEVQGLSIGSVRLHFTIETEKKVEQILNDYIQQYYFKKQIKQEFCKDYTKGHFKRGVD
ncbi:U32 family peptidase [Anaerosacchariphilus polymeriproducens]|uniref:U32 family peptidase n=1 Tax=Anaerosacchariphilus polymeriproducens TaxID=1812858 RepID=A0A371AU59_9FIRM|nr:U32 family peptidase [Anaerosacchariphilus polymeriproducens]RDU23104.1 U32 family peptidase [Anaerosacchariphilus polymeriproducens]